MYEGLRTGDIVFFKGNNKYARWIKWFTKDIHPHVGIVYSISKYQNVTVAEALGSGFVKNKYHEVGILETYEVKRVYQSLTKSRRDKLRKIIDSFIGKEYDWTSIATIVMAKFFPFIASLRTNANKLICSEAVERVYRQMGRVLTYNKKWWKQSITPLNPELVTPADLFRSKECLPVNYDPELFV